MSDTPSHNPMDSQPLRLNCPYCQREISVAVRIGQMPRCPECGQVFALADEPEDQATRAARDAELSSLHILQLARQRRSLIRSRSYVLILTFACLATAAQLSISILRLATDSSHWEAPYRTRSTMLSILMAAWLVVCLVLGRWFWRKASRLKAQVFHSDLVEPSTPPDYSQLSDGSQHVQALEQMTRPPERPQEPPSAS